jgi:hypothetical protein
MAQAYLAEGHWPRLEALALERIMACPKLRAGYERAGLRYEAAMARRKKAGIAYRRQTPIPNLNQQRPILY